MVNRIWQHHFGRGIVKSASDFGQLGTGPTHPDLLNWLAVEFPKRGWSIKDMHRLIMTSSTYRMSSKGSKPGLDKDPDNKWFWRFNMRRLTAEEVRDSMLAVSGNLNLKMGGPSIFPEMPEEVLRTSSKFKAGGFWRVSKGDAKYRRSVYIFVRRSMLMPIMTNFDFADTDQACAVRFTSVRPTQALSQMNSKFSTDQAALFAERLKREAGDDTSKQVALAIKLATQRAADAKDVADNLKFIKQMQEQFGRTPDEALRDFCLLVLNLNEFYFID